MRSHALFTRLSAGMLVTLMLAFTACAGGNTPADTTAAPATTTAPATEAEGAICAT